MADDNTVTLLGAGDTHIERDNPAEIFQHVADVLREADIAFANSEQVFSDKGCPSPIHATTSLPRNIGGLQDAGFDIISLANNHTLDWGEEGLLDTLDRLEKAGLPQVGAGANLAQARKPVILERKGQKVGFLAYSCTGPDGYEARENDCGFAPMRAWTVYERFDYQPGTPPWIHTLPHEEDLAAMEDDIRKLKEQCDVVVISFHWGQHHIPAVIPDYCFTVGRKAIDAGADLILGTHPHLLKGCEVYNGKVIFYSTCMFGFEFLHKTKRARRLRPSTRILYKEHVDPDPDYPTYPFHRDAKYSMLAKAIIKDGAIQDVTFVPVFINTNAEPEIVTHDDPRGQQVFDYMVKISESEDLNVRYEWRGDEVAILPRS